MGDGVGVGVVVCCVFDADGVVVDVVCVCEHLTVGRPLTSPESIFGLKNIFVSIIRYPDQVRGHTVESR